MNATNQLTCVGNGKQNWRAVAVFVCETSSQDALNL